MIVGKSRKKDQENFEVRIGILSNIKITLMTPVTDTDYKSLFSQLIKKQMLVLGPDITLAKVKNVVGIVVDQNGDVQQIEGDPQVLLQDLINQYVELSGLIVKKTMESILTSYPGMVGLVGSAMGSSDSNSSTSQSVPASTEQVVEVNKQEGDNTQKPTNDVKMTESIVTPQHEVTGVENASQMSASTSVVDNMAPLDEKPPAEPPSMNAMNLESLKTPTPKTEDGQKSSEPPTFSSKEMDELNKALADLAKSPLSTENKTPEHVALI